MSKKNRSRLTSNEVLALLRKHEGGLCLASLEEELYLSRKRRGELKMILEQLQAEHHIERRKGGRFALFGAQEPLQEPQGKGATGVIRLTPGGVGFVSRDDGEPDVFIGGQFLGPAMDMDRVQIKVWPGGRGPEGSVERVLVRGRKRLTGVPKKRGARWSLVTDDPRITQDVFLEEKPGEQEQGMVCLAKINKYPVFQGDPIMATLERGIGEPGILTTEVEKTIVVAGIEEAFPQEVLQEMERVAQTVCKEEEEGRTDFRHIPFVTIDPKDARDFDDAVHVEKTPTGYRLYVAIADVSHYVTEESAVDHEARGRGLSIYLPDRAIPMLPPELSAEICSLKPRVDRLALVAVMEFDASGSRQRYELHPGVIHSRARLNYQEVAKVLQGKAPDHPQHQQLELLEAFSGILHKMRLGRGCMELDLPEAKILLDEDDPLRIRDIIQSKPNPWIKKAYSLVEECMLAANEAVGQFMESKKIAVPWRIHEDPDPERLETFSSFAQLLGIDLKGVFEPGGRLNTAFQRLSCHEASRTLFYGLLRSLKQARYSEENVGHYALAATTYLHFTSPIRRYPDLAVHRALKAYWAKEGRCLGLEKPGPLPTLEEAKTVALFSTGFEKRGVEVERKVTDIYRAWFMVPLVGERYVGTVLSCTSFGVFLSIEAPFVEGMLRTEWIEEEHFVFDETLGVLKGVNTGKGIFPGDRVNIVVAKADVPQGKISFEPFESVFARIPERPPLEVTLPKAAPRGRRPERNPKRARRPSPKSRAQANRRKGQRGRGQRR